MSVPLVDTNPLADDGLADWIAPGRAALVVIDMQVDFALPEGALGRMGADLSAVPAALAAAERLTQAARAAGTPVIFVGLHTDPERDSEAWLERMRRRGGDAEAERELCRGGTPGCAFVGPRPLEGERVIRKLRYSAFFATDLDEALTELGIDTVVVCGLTTECCIDSSVRDAFHLDYHVFVVRDACAAYDADLHHATLKSLEINCAILVDTDRVVAAWRGGA